MGIALLFDLDDTLMVEEQAAAAFAATAQVAAARHEIDAALQTGGADRFEIVVVSADLGVAKPDAAVFEHALEQLDVHHADAVMIGDALELLPGLHADDIGPLDFTFIDADKENSPAYFAWSLDHSRPGSLIVADNVVRDGTLADSESEDQKVQAQRRLHEMVAAEGRVSATTIQTVGGKGYDGFMVALVER
jgi:predicted O-methyltransferase YrrM